MNKEKLLAALYGFVAQRSGIDGRNYGGSREAFMGDYNRILRDGRHARAMLAYVGRSSISAEAITNAAKSAYSGRLTISEDGEGFKMDYCAGQYFPTEYRAAVCAVLSKALWGYFRDNGSQDVRKAARRELGRGVAAIWFK